MLPAGAACNLAAGPGGSGGSSRRAAARKEARDRAILGKVRDAVRAATPLRSYAAPRRPQEGHRRPWAEPREDVKFRGNVDRGLSGVVEAFLGLKPF